MPVPKKKMAKGRTRRRRAHDRLKLVKTVKCSSCGADKLPHRACPECGKYK